MQAGSTHHHTPDLTNSGITRQLLAGAICLALFGLSACGGSSSSDSKKQESESTTQQSSSNTVGSSVNSNTAASVNNNKEKETAISTSEFQTRTNRAPILKSPVSQQITEGDEVSLALNATDPDGNSLTFSADSLPDGLSLDAASGIISGTAMTAGSFTTVITVSDGELQQQTGFTWTISEPPNTAPQLSPLDAQLFMVNEHVSLQVEASDDDDDTLSFSASNLPAGVDIDSESGNISGILQSAGNYTSEIHVSDGEDSDSIQVSWDIQDTVENSMIAWYKFDEASGNTVIDSSGTGNTGEIINGGRGTGVIGNALEMDGADDSYVNIPMSNSFRDSAEQITVMAWANRTAHHNVAVLAHNYPYGIFFGFHEYDAPTPFYSVFKWDIMGVDGGNAACWTGDAGQLNQWFHITGTYDGYNARLYVDGELICTRGMTDPIRITDHPITLSGYLRAGDPNNIKDEISGKIDDLRVYNRALSIDEIQSIYQQRD